MCFIYWQRNVWQKRWGKELKGERQFYLNRNKLGAKKVECVSVHQWLKICKLLCCLYVHMTFPHTEPRLLKKNRATWSTVHQTWMLHHFSNKPVFIRWLGQKLDPVSPPFSLVQFRLIRAKWSNISPRFVFKVWSVRWSWTSKEALDNYVWEKQGFLKGIYTFFVIWNGAIVWAYFQSPSLKPCRLNQHNSNKFAHACHVLVTWVTPPTNCKRLLYMYSIT